MLGFLTRSGGSEHPFDVATVSSRGLVRRENQDHFLADAGHGVFCVADGMGGGEGGARASAIACEEVAKAVRSAEGFADRLMRVTESFSRAKEAIVAVAREAGYRQMATTVVSLLVRTGPEPYAFVGHIGDSRAYRYRDGALEALTVDHTVAEAARAEGFGRDVDEALLERMSHVLTRAIGVGTETRADWRRIEVRAGDRFLLCSDGLYDMVPAAAIAAAFAAGGDAAAVLARLESATRAAGAEDNYTMIVIGM